MGGEETPLGAQQVARAPSDKVAQPFLEGVGLAVVLEGMDGPRDVKEDELDGVVNGGRIHAPRHGPGDHEGVVTLGEIGPARGVVEVANAPEKGEARGGTVHFRS